MNTSHFALLLSLLACTAGQDPSPTATWVDLEAAADATCALDSAGEAACWGSPPWTEAAPPAGPFVQLAMSIGRACGLREDGTLSCWGYEDEFTALEEPPTGTYSSVALGDQLGCARREAGDYACWGDTDQLVLPEHSDAVSFDVTGSGLCELDVAGHITCTGILNGNTPLHADTPPEGAYIGMDLAHSSGCAVRAGGEAVDCWASRIGGVEVLLEGSAFVTVFTGQVGACALDIHGELSCAGSNAPYRDEILLSGPFVDVAAGSDHLCALHQDGEIVCQGANDNGQSTPPPGRQAAAGAD